MSDAEPGQGVPPRGDGGIPGGDPAVEQRTAQRRSGLVAAGIGLSRIAGFVRQRAIGHFLGTGFAADAFTQAFKIPNLLQNLLGEGTLSASFIPVYSRLLSEGRDEEAGRVAGAIAGLLTLAAGVLVVLAVVFAGPLTDLIAPGFVGRRRDLTVTLVRIITPGIGLLVLSAWALGVLNSHRRFFLSYVAPVLWNVAQVAALVGAGLLLLDDIGAPSAADMDTIGRIAVALGWGTVAGGALQLVVQLPGVLRLSSGLRPSLSTSIPGVRRVLSAFAPIVAGRGVVQLLAFLDQVLASLLATGAVAALAFAQTLYVLPISLFGMSVAASELPDFADADPDDLDALTRRLDGGLARIAAFVVPTAAAFVVIGDLLVGALFRSGSFGSLDARLVWFVLLGFTVGLLANTSSRLLQSVLYGNDDPVTPAKVAAIRVLASAAVGALLMLQLDRFVVTAEGVRQIGDLPAFSLLPQAVRDASQEMGRLHLGAVGLSVAAGASSWIEYRLLRRTVERRTGRTVQIAGGRLRPVAGAALLAAGAALAARVLVVGWHPIPAAGVAGTAFAGVYFVAARRLGVRDIAELADLFRDHG